jgi:site-specific recombinase XerD
MAKQLARLLRPQHPASHDLTNVLHPTRALLEIGAAPLTKRLPALLTEAALGAFDAAVWHAHQRTHVVMLKRVLCTGIRKAARVRLRLTAMDLQTAHLRITPGNGPKDRDGLLPQSCRGELAPYLERQRTPRATALVESTRPRPSSTRRLRQLVKPYAWAAGIAKRVYPPRFRQPLRTALTRQGSIRPKRQLLSGHAAEQRLAVDRALALSEVAAEDEAAMRGFPVR